MRSTRHVRRQRSSPAFSDRSRHSGKRPDDAGNRTLALDRATEWLLAQPAFDRILASALRHPRLLVALVAIAGTALTAWSIAPFWRGDAGTVPAADSAAITPAPSSGDDALRLIAAYNQASAVAAAQGRADLLAPYLAPDGPAWRAVQQEYARRAISGERREATLARWGVLKAAIDTDTAIVETQEQWDVVTIAGGDIVSSRRGVLLRNAYMLRLDAGGWRIVDVATTVLMN
ncbi:MAG: hypothetical protein HXY39_07860 [Chloroflexi bacterium]|nr:hypothetical protein [Chloroflexota bacterium]